MSLQQYSDKSESSSISADSPNSRKPAKISLLSDKSNICSKLSRKRLHIKPRRFYSTDSPDDSENNVYHSSLTSNIPMTKTKPTAKLSLDRTDEIIENATPPSSPAMENGDENVEPRPIRSSSAIGQMFLTSHTPVKRYKSSYDAVPIPETNSAWDNDDEILSTYARISNGSDWHLDKIDSALRDKGTQLTYSLCLFCGNYGLVVL